MPNRILFVLTILGLSFSAEAQSDSFALRPRYFLSVHSGGLVGKKGDGSFLTSSLIQGVRFDRLAVGLGIGYDAYVDWRVIPVFMNLNYDLGRSPGGNSLFIQFNGGVSKAWNPWLSEVETVYNEEANININPMVGYRIIADKSSLYISIGYKSQVIEFGWGYPGGDKTFVRRQTGRVAIQLGFGFR